MRKRLVSAGARHGPPLDEEGRTCVTAAQRSREADADRLELGPGTQSFEHPPIERRLTSGGGVPRLRQVQRGQRDVGRLESRIDTLQPKEAVRQGSCRN